MSNEMNDQTMIGALLAIVGVSGQKAFEEKLWQNRDTDIGFEGKKIILPAEPSPMGLEIAIKTLQRKLADENQMMDIIEKVPGFPFDAAVALVKAMQRTYGWASAVPTPGFFGDRNPDLITVKTGPKFADTVQVPMGSFRLPGVENDILVHIDGHGDGSPSGLCIHGNVRKRERTVIMELIALTKKIMHEESIYSGKALRILVDDDGDLIKGLEPVFIETDHIKVNELIMSRSVWDQINVSLLTPIIHTDACIKHGIPLRRGILLEGKFGTGKTLTASVTSRVCVDHDWTFITIDKVKGLKAALEFARDYQPAVVFAEDIDRITDERDDAANDLLNTIDGVLNKDARVITVLTTNDVEKIEQAMLRPGRLDAVISVNPPDAEAAQRLVRLYARGLIKDDEDLSGLGAELDGQIPATIREVVERSKLSMVNGGRSMMIEEDLIISARGMTNHLNLLNRPKDKEQTAGDKIAAGLNEIIGGVDQTDLSTLSGKVDLGVKVSAQAREAARAASQKIDQIPVGIDPKTKDAIITTAKRVLDLHKDADLS